MTSEEVINQAIADFDSIEAAIKRKGVNVPKGTDTKEYAALIDSIQGSGLPTTFVIQDENGNEAVAVLVEEKTVFTATENDIREGTVAATEKGVVTGTKVIPSYHTTEGYAYITPNSTFLIKSLSHSDRYDFTKLQAIICPLAGSAAQSVAAEKVSIDGKVFAVNSNVVIAEVTKDSENKYVNLGITNDSENIYVLRYLTYKEIY